MSNVNPSEDAATVPHVHHVAMSHQGHLPHNVALSVSKSIGQNIQNGNQAQQTGFVQQTGAIQNASFGGYHFVPDVYDPRSAHRPFEALADYSSMRMQQAQHGSRPMEKADNVPSQKIPFSAVEDRAHSRMMYEREARWAEVRKYSEVIQRFAEEASHLEVTKENYYDLYNMAVCLLKAVDGLDPDKIQVRKAQENELSAQPNLTPQFAVAPTLMSGSSTTDLELLQARRSFDYYYNRSGFNEMPMYYNNQQIPLSAPYITPTAPQFVPVKTESKVKQYNNNNSTEFLDDAQSHLQSQAQSDQGKETQEDKKSKKQRRRRTVYTSKRNLHCHMCGVTETPEWRRGPAGDHTLCNACGLHYAKSLKKQKKETDGKKDSAEDTLLNVSISDEQNTIEEEAQEQPPSAVTMTELPPPSLPQPTSSSHSTPDPHNLTDAATLT